MIKSAMSVKGVWWYWTIYFPVLLVLAAGVGLVAGGFRAVTGFIPGMHGMFFGSMLAFIGGRWAWRDHSVRSVQSQFSWTWLNLFMTCVLTTGITLSRLYRGPLDGTFDWLSDVVRGSTGEPFFGARVINPIEGVLSGWGWIAFNLFDLALFLVVGMIVFGVTVDKCPGSASEKKAAGKAKAPGSSKATSRPMAWRLFCFQWLVLILLVVSPRQVTWQKTVPVAHDPEARMRLASYTGRYVFEEGGGLLEPAGQGGAFTAAMRGLDGLILVSEPAERYVIHLDYDGKSFNGRLMRGGSPVYVRARVSADGRRLSLAGPVYRQGRHVGDVLVEALKE